MKMIENMEETEMTDFEFAKWLNAHGEWSFDSMSAITATRFFLQQSKELLAIVLYDNQKCERKIFIPARKTTPDLPPEAWNDHWM